ncbi:hypothetical protein IZ6_31540 [Terrihabitans soli]|uniref:Uncharacterized protein n=1 Tax=Terrihabitans soli TaxID=708113 RepID=A0A6S6QTJ8_9HYPH|nr:hypothetical protein [Terrihabitans soli]BCJ92419.1 hypothetical protein IZ6_31540 [Terrihabitans soli]
MPILIFILLVIAIAHVGFWDTLQAVFGAIGVIIVFFLIMAGLVASVIAYLYARVRRKF